MQQGCTLLPPVPPPLQVRDGRVRNVRAKEVPGLLKDGWTLLDVRPSSELDKVRAGADWCGWEKDQWRITAGCAISVMNVSRRH